MRARSRVVCARATISPPSAHTKIPLVALKTPVRPDHVAYRNTTYSPPDTGAGPDDDTGAGPDTLPAASSSVGGKYVPPSMRSGARGAGESMRGLGGAANRDDLPTLRVTNISEDTQENDLRDLFGVFGRVARVYVGRDRETGAGKGFAFVSFEEKSCAQKAIDKVHGRGYDNLILSVQWSRMLFFLLPLGHAKHVLGFVRAAARWTVDRDLPIYFRHFLLSFICLLYAESTMKHLHNRTHDNNPRSSIWKAHLQPHLMNVLLCSTGCEKIALTFHAIQVPVVLSLSRKLGTQFPFIIAKHS